MTRVNGYGVLREALSKTKQTGVIKLLETVTESKTDIYQNQDKRNQCNAAVKCTLENIFTIPTYICFKLEEQFTVPHAVADHHYVKCFLDQGIKVMIMFV